MRQVKSASEAAATMACEPKIVLSGADPDPSQQTTWQQHNLPDFSFLLHEPELPFAVTLLKQCFRKFGVEEPGERSGKQPKERASRRK